MRYEETHPWISFEFDMGALGRNTWMLLGEATSKCEHVAGVPLKPAVAEQLNIVYLSKGAFGTTSIEGNTLTEEEVRKVVEGELDLPPSQEYRAREVQNFIYAANEIVKAVELGVPMPLTPERLAALNGKLLEELPLHEGVVPGVLRDYEVGVNRYRAAPAEDCKYLLERLCEWVDGPTFDVGPNRDLRFARAFLRAALAHLYLAWIHPFGDGNGRLARLIEFQLLLEGGVPLPAAHLLSDFYNATRDKYYIELERTEHPPFSVERFIHYALEGFVDEVRQQIKVLRNHQHQVTWENFVHDQFSRETTPAKLRQRHLVLDLPNKEWTSRRDLPGLTPRLAAAYAGKGPKAVTRDVNALAKKGLLTKRGQRVRPRTERVMAFLPLRAVDEDHEG